TSDPGSRPSTATQPANTTANLDTANNLEPGTPTAPATAPADNGVSVAGGGLRAGWQATGTGSRSASGDRNLAAAMSNATTEAVWQIQISGCAAYCRGTRQAQTAEQKNTTIQVLASAPGVVTGSGAPAENDAGSPPTISITHVQLGCLSQ